MKAKRNRKTAALFLLAMVVGLLLPACGEKEPEYPEQTGQIYLYGEYHGFQSFYEKEFALWSRFYHERGMRHLFIELPYYDTQYLNLWMQEDGDRFLEAIYGIPGPQQTEARYIVDLFRKIKKECPETVLHGTDVGHDYDTIGVRYLEYLESIGEKDSEQYRLAQENREQGIRFYWPEEGTLEEHLRRDDWAYREQRMVDNFVREMDALGETDVMGIYGLAHVELGLMNYMTEEIPNMSTQLQERYGERLHAEDVRDADAGEKTMLISMGTVEMGGKEYAAEYYGIQDAANYETEFEHYEYWRLLDAFEDVRHKDVNFTYTSYDTFPVRVEDGQVLLIEGIRADGTKYQWFYRSNGFKRGNGLVAEGFDPDS